MRQVLACSRSRRGRRPHWLHRSSVTSRGLRANNRNCRTSALPAPADERIFLRVLPPLSTQKKNCEKHSSLEPAAARCAQFAGERRLAFLFSGQASQYARMGAELYRHQPVFRDEVDRCAEIVGGRLGRPLRDVLLGDDADSTLIDETAYTQPALFAVQAGLIALWRSWGIVPTMVLGHSVGEFAAAYSAGVYTLEQVLDLVVERARLMQGLPRNGAMAAIFANQEIVAAAIQQFDHEAVSIAALNAPENTVISGAREAVTALVARFESLGNSMPIADCFPRLPFSIDAQRRGRVGAYRRSASRAGLRKSPGSRR